MRDPDCSYWSPGALLDAGVGARPGLYPGDIVCEKLGGLAGAKLDALAGA